jgi:hypothetical protein
MASADLELQGAIVAALQASGDVRSLIDQRIYDNPSHGAVLPYVTLGETQDLRTDMVGANAFTIFATLHAWSDYPGGFMEVKQVSNAVIECVHHARLVLSSYRLVSIEHRNTRTFRDPDGVTSHAVIEFVAFVERQN